MTLKLLAAATLVALPVYSFSQTFDCSAYRNVADNMACKDPVIKQQKATYENMLMQLRRANPEASRTIAHIDHQKKQEVQAQCQDARCVSTWYDSQMAALRDDTWAPKPQPPAQRGPRAVGNEERNSLQAADQGTSQQLRDNPPPPKVSTSTPSTPPKPEPMVVSEEDKAHMADVVTRFWTGKKCADFKGLMTKNSWDALAENLGASDDMICRTYESMHAKVRRVHITRFKAEAKGVEVESEVFLAGGASMSQSDYLEKDNGTWKLGARPPYRSSR